MANGPWTGPTLHGLQGSGGERATVISVLMATSVQTFTIYEKLTLCKKRKVACTEMAALTRNCAETLNKLSSAQRACGTGITVGGATLEIHHTWKPASFQAHSEELNRTPGFLAPDTHGLCMCHE